MSDESWRTHAFRQSIVAKIDEAIKQSGTPTTKNSVEMENHVFMKAKSKEEYLSLVARLILHVREMNSKKGAGMNTGGTNQGGPGMPDPINALQNLASQGTRNTQMIGMGGPQGPPNMNTNTASNLLQTLNNRPGQGNMGGMQNMGNKMPGMQMGQNQGPMGNMMPGQMSNQLQGPLTNQLQGQVQGQVIGNQMTGQMGQMSGQITNQMAGQMPGMPSQLVNQMPNHIITQMPHCHLPNNVNFSGPRTVTPSGSYMRQSPTPSAHSPASLGSAPSSNQMVPSPALVPSPSSQMTMMSGPQRSVGMAPSPGSSLNTPGQAAPTPSPLGMQEDQAYRDKVRQLSKYIEPLRKMIARMGNDDVEKLSKMKKLLEVLSNPTKRMPLETLLKCEVVLEKMDLKRGESGSSTGTTSTNTQLAALKEHYIFNPLLEAISNSLQSTVFNHTLQRTFGPSTEALNGPEIKGLPAPLKRKRVEEPTSDIPDVLQGEIARLDARFKVSLDPIQQPRSRTVQLICWLDDRHLPCVPPVSLSVPEDYPKSPPNCSMAENEYNATPFLTLVQKALLTRIGKLPKRFSVSQLLNTWEMSVRQACAPTQVPVSSATVLMGL
ncbi:mediator of RNA polymerase II transcription subunit 15 isoform X2 [Chrysoperla carnea]|uniref:mediator of RNA polymerase II transcription subunit 15 isoform X2 n=1 Tax=Chrysoperla carnea TaxID=189513 RepID=UPI001D08350B|nr:mediator of RNA polymerase II transcription subunit 15 isoform X2 [Chrysoperla carnea]